MSGYITSYPKIYWLKTNIYCLIVSVVQSCGHDLAGYLWLKILTKA